MTSRFEEGRESRNLWRQYYCHDVTMEDGRVKKCPKLLDIIYGRTPKQNAILLQVSLKHGSKMFKHIQNTIPIGFRKKTRSFLQKVKFHNNILPCFLFETNNFALSQVSRNFCGCCKSEIKVFFSPNVLHKDSDSPLSAGWLVPMMILLFHSLFNFGNS